MKSKTINELSEQIENDLKIRVDNLEEESARTPILFSKYYNELRLVETELVMIESKLKKLKKEKWLYYSGKAHPDVYAENPLDFKLMKSDIKMHIESDDDVVKLVEYYELVKIKKQMLRAVLEQISSRSFTINNIIKMLYFKHGIV